MSPSRPQRKPFEAMWCVLKAHYYQIWSIPRTSTDIKNYVERVTGDINSDSNFNMANLCVGMRKYVYKAYIGKVSEYK